MIEEPSLGDLVIESVVVLPLEDEVVGLLVRAVALLVEMVPGLKS